MLSIILRGKMYITHVSTFCIIHQSKFPSRALQSFQRLNFNSTYLFCRTIYLWPQKRLQFQEHFLGLQTECCCCCCCGCCSRNRYDVFGSRNSIFRKLATCLGLFKRSLIEVSRVTGATKKVICVVRVCVTKKAIWASSGVQTVVVGV